MDKLLEWLSKNPNIIFIFLFLIVLVVVILVIIYLIAFLQGREISFYPPKIGSKLKGTENRSEQIIFGKAMGNVFLIPFYKHHPTSFRADMSSASDIWMMGLALQKTIDENYDQIQQRVVSGKKVRILITDPHNKSITKGLAERFALPGTTGDDFQKGFNVVLRQLSELRKLSGNKDCLQIRLMDFIPPFSLYIFPNHMGVGRCYVEIYGYKMYKAIPKFVLSESETQEWYDHFLNQFQVVWENSKIVETAA